MRSAERVAGDRGGEAIERAAVDARGQRKVEREVKVLPRSRAGRDEVDDPLGVNT